MTSRIKYIVLGSRILKQQGEYVNIFFSHRLAIFEHNSLYMCIKLYEGLQRNFKGITNYHLFGRKLFTLLLNNEPYTLLEFIDKNGFIIFC